MMITDDHLEWAVVDRLRQMLEAPPHRKYNVTQVYSLFTTILCWVMQRVRTPEDEITSDDDRKLYGGIARELYVDLLAAAVEGDPWWVHVAPTTRTAKIGEREIEVPASTNFESYNKAAQFLVNLRDATAHGDARNVKPFHVRQLLVGFTFTCRKFKGRGADRKKVWEGEITLLESDMRRIGGELARLYCHKLSGGDSQFDSDAARSVREVRIPMKSTRHSVMVSPIVPG